MLDVLETVYSLPFLLGALAGSILWKLYCLSKARYMDRHSPLPDGAKHAVARMSRQWIAALCAILSLGYVLLATEKTQLHTEQLSAAVIRCWGETYLEIKAQVEINAQNDQISRQQQALQREYDEDTSSWLKDLVNPPNGLADRTANDPDRQAYGLQRTAEYQGQLDDLGKRFDGLVADRKQLDEQRAAHPLPEQRCGK